MRDVLSRVLRAIAALGWLLAIAGAVWFGPSAWSSWQDSDPAGMVLLVTVLVLFWLPLASALWLVGAFLQVRHRPVSGPSVWFWHLMAVVTGMAGVWMVITSLSTGGLALTGQTLLLSLPLFVLTTLLVVATLPVADRRD